jgi:alkaline phosphatase D
VLGCSTGHSQSRPEQTATKKPPGAESVTVSVAPPPDTFTLAFGSCNQPSFAQPLWGPIRDLMPDAWAWLGDIVYADTNNVKRTRKLYAAQRAQPDYAMLAASTHVVGVWDDHDYGKNDAGHDYESRAESQAALLDFLGEPADSARRRQVGTYASYVFGEGERRVKLVLMDARYHRERPGPEADTLGEEQWAWLERELTTDPANLTVIASSYQVLPNQHPNETWGHFPRARRRFLDLLAKPSVPGVVLLSGDRHFAELSVLESDALGYPLHELTSSGLTHSYLNAGEPNGLRVGDLYPRKNFGAVRVDWTTGQVTLEARGVRGLVAIDRTFPLSALRG